MTTTYPRAGGGGGGAGAAGRSGWTGTADTLLANGGDGRSSDITGTSTYYAGGGGGGPISSYAYAGNNAYRGGLGGGGDAQISWISGYGAASGYSTRIQQPGDVNTGGGGGGRNNGNLGDRSGSNGGGSGVIILRVPSGYGVSGTAVRTETVVGSDKVVTITGSGTISFINSIFPIDVDYLVIGGGGAGNPGGGGGGAGGYRTSFGSGNVSGRNSAVETPISVSAGTAYTVTVEWWRFYYEPF